MAFAAGSAVSRPSLRRPPADDPRFSYSKPPLLPTSGRCWSWKLATLVLAGLCLVLVSLLGESRAGVAAELMEGIGAEGADCI